MSLHFFQFFRLYSGLSVPRGILLYGPPFNSLDCILVDEYKYDFDKACEVLLSIL